MYTCDIDLTEFDRCVGETKRELEQGLHHAVRTAADEAVRQGKRGRFKDKTGELRRNIHAEKLLESARGARWKVVSPEPYSIFVEDGTKEHDIWPKAVHELNGPVRNGQSRRASGDGPHEHVVGRGQFLRWKTGGRTFFARMVHHPGSPAFGYMGAAALKAERVLYRDLELLRERMGTVWKRAA